MEAARSSRRSRYDVLDYLVEKAEVGSVIHDVLADCGLLGEWGKDGRGRLWMIVFDRVVYGNTAHSLAHNVAETVATKMVDVLGIELETAAAIADALAFSLTIPLTQVAVFDKPREPPKDCGKQQSEEDLDVLLREAMRKIIMQVERTAR